MPALSTVFRWLGGRLPGAIRARGRGVNLDRSVRRAENQRPGLLRGARAAALRPSGMDALAGWGKAWVILPHDGAPAIRSLPRHTKAQSGKPALTCW